MKEQKTTKWSNFNPLCLARHVLRNLWMTVLAGLICVMAVYLLQTLVSKPSYDSQVTFAVTSRSASATASGSIAVTDSVASQFGELLQSNPVRTAAAAEMGLNAFPGTCSVDVPENTNILILTVTAPTPELAFRGALAVMDCYESYADFILASAVLNPINGPTLPSQPSARRSARIHSVRCSMRCARAIPTFSSTRHPSASSPMPRCWPMQPMPRSSSSGRTSSPPPS